MLSLCARSASRSRRTASASSENTLRIAGALQRKQVRGERTRGQALAQACACTTACTTACTRGRRTGGRGRCWRRRCHVEPAKTGRVGLVPVPDHEVRIVHHVADDLACVRERDKGRRNRFSVGTRARAEASHAPDLWHVGAAEVRDQADARWLWPVERLERLAVALPDLALSVVDHLADLCEPAPPRGVDR